MAPLKITVPNPDFIKFPDPDITPEYVAVLDWLKVASPLAREILFSTVAPFEELIEDPPPKLIVPEPDTDPEPVVSTNPPDPDLVILALMMISLSASKVRSLLLEDDIAERTVISPSWEPPPSVLMVILLLANAVTKVLALICSSSSSAV